MYIVSEWAERNQLFEGRLQSHHICLILILYGIGLIPGSMNRDKPLMDKVSICVFRSVFREFWYMYEIQFSKSGGNIVYRSRPGCSFNPQKLSLGIWALPMFIHQPPHIVATRGPPASIAPRHESISMALKLRHWPKAELLFSLNGRLTICAFESKFSQMCTLDGLFQRPFKAPPLSFLYGFWKLLKLVGL